MTDWLLKFFECHKPGSCEHFSYFMCWNKPFARRTLDVPLFFFSQRRMPPDRRAIITRAIISNTDVSPGYVLVVRFSRPFRIEYKKLKREENVSRVRHYIDGHVRVCVNENIFVISRARRSHKLLLSAVVVAFFPPSKISVEQQRPK